MSMFSIVSTSFVLLFAQDPAPPDEKLLVWYDARDPATTFRHRAYDLRKKAFDEPAVRAWTERIRREFPTYRVKLVDVRLSDWPGMSDDERLLQAVQHEVGIAYPPVRFLERGRFPIGSPGPMAISRPSPLRPINDRVPGPGGEQSAGDVVVFAVPGAVSEAAPLNAQKINQSQMTQMNADMKNFLSCASSAVDFFPESRNDAPIAHGIDHQAFRRRPRAQ